MSICIIRGHKPLISETFLDAHAQRLKDELFVLHNYFPEYTYNGCTLRYFYSRHPVAAKVKRLLPQFLYDRWVTKHELSPSRTLDFMTGFVRTHQIDVILAEYGFNGADIAPIARQIGLPLVVHFHGHDVHRWPEIEPYLDRYRDMFSYADRLLSVSHVMTDTLIRLGADPAKIVYNPYGAREYFFEIQPDYRQTLLAIGRFADIKAPYLTLMAFRDALSAFPDARLVLVGDGPLLEACKGMVKTWSIEGNVTFRGALPHEEVLPLMNQARAFVQHSVTTSYGDMEGMPNSILEAGAAALPVISTRHAGISTAVIDGETGFLVDECDVSGMTERMCRLLGDEEQCRRMGANARRHIHQNYHIDRHIACLQTVIDEIRDSGRSSAAKTQNT